jgi:pyruvate/2-oxoglutarate dehydrogenase complex dihydrolipoamide acyltransferase (E2) component
MSSLPTDSSATIVDVVMPQMGVSVAEGTVVAWHKRPGDWVTADETICEISTDKIDTEVPAPSGGRVVELLVPEGETVPVGAVLARVATDAVAGEPHPDEQGPVAGRLPAADADAPEPASTHVTPVVARMAEREGIDLSLVTGTGRGGRVRKQDVLAYMQNRDKNGTGAEATASPPPLHTESPYREDPGSPGAPVAPSTPPASHGGTPAAPLGGEHTSEPLSRMRRSIAEHMVRSLHTAAHCTSIMEVDMSAVEAARAKAGVTALAFVARATVDAMRAHPQLNATLQDDVLTRHADVNLGIAVSLGEDGLIVPVVARAQELSVEGLSARIRELASRAREGTLTPDEVAGGTFTITNPGGFGTLASTPIINQPQVAILDLEAVVKRAVVLTDQRGDSIAIRPMTNLCLSWDHRALDGALAARFLATLRERLEDWRG